MSRQHRYAGSQGSRRQTIEPVSVMEENNDFLSSVIKIVRSNYIILINLPTNTVLNGFYGPTHVFRSNFKVVKVIPDWFGPKTEELEQRRRNEVRI